MLKTCFNISFHAILSDLAGNLCWRISEVMNWLVAVLPPVNIRGQKSACTVLWILYLCIPVCSKVALVHCSDHHIFLDY